MYLHFEIFNSIYDFPSYSITLCLWCALYIAYYSWRILGIFISQQCQDVSGPYLTLGHFIKIEVSLTNNLYISEWSLRYFSAGWLCISHTTFNVQSSPCTDICWPFKENIHPHLFDPLTFFLYFSISLIFKILSCTPHSHPKLFDFFLF